MSIYEQFKQFLNSESKSDELAITPQSGWERFGLDRPNTKLRFDKDSYQSAYAAHELVYACVNKTADVMNDAEIIVEEQTGGEWKTKEAHPLTALFKRPNDYETGKDFRRLIVQSEQTAGIFYAEIIRSAAKIPVALVALNPTRVMPRVNRSSNELTYYEYTHASGTPRRIEPENMLIRRRVDLVNRFYGLSPVAVALKSINSDLGFTDYVDAFFESDGTPSGILKILNATVSDTKKEAMQAAWRQKYSRGGSNQKGLAVLDQNAEYQRIGANLNELAADSLTGRFESRICAVFGVPPNLVGALVGLQHVTSNATAKSELRNFWDNKISPELAALREWLTWFVLPQFENIEDVRAGKIRVAFDISQAAFLQEDVDKIHTRARENFKAGFLTLNEARAEVGLMPDDAGDYYLQPFNISAVSPENRALEAAKQVEQGTSPAAVEEIAVNDEPKALPPPDEKKTRKSVEYDGLTLSRQPRGVELLIDLKSLAEDFTTEKEKTVKILNAFRTELISQTSDAIKQLDAAAVYQLTLTPNPKTTKQINKVLQSAYKRGRLQVAAELAAQKSAKGLAPDAAKAGAVGDDQDYSDDETISMLSDSVIARIINEIQSRAVNSFVSLSLLKLSLDEIIPRLKELLGNESAKFIEQLAGNAVNSSIREGRDGEMWMRADEIAEYSYSALLDASCCENCEEADEMTASSLDELPDAPNPDCSGLSSCRCFIIATIA